MSKIANPVSSAPLTREELVRSLVEGERRFHELPKDLPAAEAAEIRRLALEEMTSTPLSNIGHHSLDVQRASHRHCENFIGVAQIPMGVVGPLKVRGEFADGDFWVPLATTEAALVASTNRGCAALREAGGAVVRVEDVGMTRAPVFRTSGIVQTQQFLRWIEDHTEEIRQLTEETSRYLRLLDVRPYAFGTTVFLRFRFDTGDAMGMNMATIACDRAVNELIEPATGVPCIGLSGNYCVDKKPSHVNFHEGRGKRIYAEILLDAPILHHILKTDARNLVEVQYRKNLLGSIAAGSMGYNAHFANVVAGLLHRHRPGPGARRRGLHGRHLHRAARPGLRLLPPSSCPTCRSARSAAAPPSTPSARRSPCSASLPIRSAAARRRRGWPRSSAPSCSPASCR